MACETTRLFLYFSFQIQKARFVTFFELFHTFSRTLTTMMSTNLRGRIFDRQIIDRWRRVGRWA